MRARWLATALWVLGCRREAAAPEPRRFRDVGAAGAEAELHGRACGRCHRREYEAWRRSQHARAQRAVDRRDARALQTLPAGVMREDVRGVIGVAPLQQYLVAVGHGRVQVLDPAYDPARREWFSVFGGELRRPEEWGHWTQRGMNWNAQCAACHTSGYAKGYDARVDAWRSTWDAVGVTCARCHGDAPGHAERPDVVHADEGLRRARRVDTCAGCHARREELTGAYEPGASFDDHHRPTLPDTPGAYFADGRAADEDFEFVSLSLSRMGQRGVSCHDCHEPHSGALRVSNTRDGLCLTCHGAPGARGAPVIDAIHSHHAPTSDGARCVSCHMPVMRFMQRDLRRDHGFTTPDPALSRELGLPDVCTGCHTDRSLAWAEAQTVAWYGAAMDRASRMRARIVARASRGDASVVPELVAWTAREDSAAWRAAYIAWLAPWQGRPGVLALLRRSLHDASPWVQTAAIQALTGDEASRDDITALCRAPTRSVRIAAVWAMRGTDACAHTSARSEMERWIEVSSDQPAGALRRSEVAALRGDRDDARRWAERAVRWDPSGATWAALGRLLDAQGDAPGALRAFSESMRLDARVAAHPYARALVLAAVGRRAEAIEDLERAVAIDASFGRAYYNLGLARAEANQLPEALAALRRAEATSDDPGDALWARATVHLRMGDRAAAVEAARRVLVLRPEHPGAAALLREAGALSGASESAR